MSMTNDEKNKPFSLQSHENFSKRRFLLVTLYLSSNMYIYTHIISHPCHQPHSTCHEPNSRSGVIRNTTCLPCTGKYDNETSSGLQFRLNKRLLPHPPINWDRAKGFSPAGTEWNVPSKMGLKKGFYSSQTASVSKRTLAIVSRNWSVRIIIMTSERDLKLPLLSVQALNLASDARVWPLPHGGSTRPFLCLKPWEPSWVLLS